MTSCLVFGGNGFIGSHLVENLTKKGYDVKVFDRDNSNLNGVEIIKGDFFNESDVSNALKDVDYVFHYISTTTPATSMKNPIYDIESNIIGSVKMFQSAVKNNIKKIIFASSGGTVYGNELSQKSNELDPVNPVSPYAISKLTIEKYLYYFNYLYGMDYTILRYSNPYGERQNPLGKQGVIPIFLNRIKNGENPTIYGDGSMVRDYIYIKDAIDATVSVLETNTNKKVFNIGSGKGTSLNELVDIMSGVVSRKVTPEYLENNGTYIPRIVVDISEIQKMTGWKPTTNLPKGIQKTWEWIRRNY